MKRLIAFLTLFTSASTLICCALPALFVMLGLGASFAGLIGAVPQLVWFSENKVIVFGFGAVMLAIGGFFQFRSRIEVCPIDPKLGNACKETKNWSKGLYLFSVGMFGLGAFFAFVIPIISS
jgi:hypothetical protein